MMMKVLLLADHHKRFKLQYLMFLAPKEGKLPGFLLTKMPSEELPFCSEM